MMACMWEVQRCMNSTICNTPEMLSAGAARGYLAFTGIGRV